MQPLATALPAALAVLANPTGQPGGLSAAPRRARHDGDTGSARGDPGVPRNAQAALPPGRLMESCDAGHGVWHRLSEA